MLNFERRPKPPTKPSTTPSAATNPLEDEEDDSAQFQTLAQRRTPGSPDQSVRCSQPAKRVTPGSCKQQEQEKKRRV